MSKESRDAEADAALASMPPITTRAGFSLTGYRKLSVSVTGIAAVLAALHWHGSSPSCIASVGAIASIVGAFCVANLMEHRAKGGES